MNKTSLFDCVIFEGPDGAGKSTIIDTLVGYDDRCLGYHSGGTVNNMADLARRLQENYRFIKTNKKRLVLLDRMTLISEQVYGPIIRDGSLITYDLARLHLYAFSPIIVYCRPEGRIIEENLEQQREKAHKSQEHIDKIILKSGEIVIAYDDLMEALSQSFMVIPYDYGRADETDSLYDLIKCVVS